MNAIIPTMVKAMEHGIAHLRQELGKLRTGRASLALLEAVRVETYGQQMPLNQVATLNIPEPRLITIQPWDVSVIPAIEKAIQAAQLGLSPSNDGKVIRLPIPALTEERRKEIVKLVRRSGEEAKVVMRNARRDANEQVKQLEKASGHSEDEIKRTQQEIQKRTDAFVAEIDTIIATKEKEVLTV